MSDSPAATTGVQSPLVDARHPWLGLLPFKEAHGAYFFGRDAEIVEILTRIRENSLTILFGQSGLGKSSLLGAGVVPKLRNAAFRPLLLRLDYTPGAPSLLLQTRNAFHQALPEIARPDDALAITLWELFHRLPALLPAGSPAPVLIFDQFEEIFTLGRQDPAREQEAELWLEQIADLLQNRPPCALEERFAENRRLARDYDFSPASLRIVFALREDYLSHLESWKHCLPLVTQNRMGIELLGGHQALEAVLGPASLGESPIVSREVAAGIIRTVSRVGPDTPLPRIRAVPPLLSLLCEQLNAARLTAGTAEITAAMVTGQADDILQRFYVESFGAFPPEHRESIREMIEDPPMITEGGHRNALVRDDAENQLKRMGVADPRAVFDTLIQRRVITVEEKDFVQRLEVTHDVLVPLLVRSRKERRDRVAREHAERKLAEERTRTRRRRLVTTAATTLMLVAVAGAIYGFLSAREAGRQRDEAERARVDAAAQRDEANRQRVSADQQRDEARYNEGLGWMLRARVAEERNHQYPDTLLYAAKAIGFDGVGRPADAPAELLRFIREDRNPDAYAGARKWISERPAYLPVWASDLRPAAATGLSLSPEGRWLALGSADGSVRLWDFRDGRETTIISPGGPAVADVAFQRTGSLLAIAAGDRIRFWDRAKSAFAADYEDHATRLAWSPGGTMLIAAAADGTIHLWREGRLSEIRTGKDKPAASLSFSVDNSTLAAAFPGAGVSVIFPHVAEPANAWSQLDPKNAETLDEEKGRALLDLAKQLSKSTAVALSPDAAILAAGGSDGALSLWDAVGAAFSGQVPLGQRHAGAVRSLCFRQDGLQIASGSDDGTVRLWTITENVPSVTATFTGHAGAVAAVQYAPCGDILASAGADGSVRLWNVSGKKASPADLYTYLREKWYRFDGPAEQVQVSMDAQQTLTWAGGTGFANVPPDSMTGIWQAGGDAAFPRLLAAGEWSGAATLMPESGKKDLSSALLADAQDSAKNHRWNRVELRLGQLQALGAGEAAGLESQRRAFGVEGQPFTTPDGLSLLWCPPGSFIMGSPANERGRMPVESQHKVTLSHGIWLSQFELTQAQWLAVMGSNPSMQKAAGLNSPVENISWFEAEDFCRRLTDRDRGSGTLPAGWEYALPTEAQWEYACRAGTTSAYSFGDDPARFHLNGNYNDIAGKFNRNFDAQHDDKHKFAAPVGSYLPNPWKFHDMHGNVWEWCRDSLDPEKPDYAPAEATDPLGSAGPLRTYRGGGCVDPAPSARAAGRSASPPELKRNSLGFRPAMVPSGNARPQKNSEQ